MGATTLSITMLNVMTRSIVAGSITTPIIMTYQHTLSLILLNVEFSLITLIVIWMITVAPRNYDPFGFSTQNFILNISFNFLGHRIFNLQPLLLPAHILLMNHLISIVSYPLSVYINSCAC